MTSHSAASDPLGLVGTTIAEKYAIEGIVGEGGFAIVYRATHLLWKRPVAVKVFKSLSEVAADQRAKLLDDFIQEGALLAELSERSTAIVQARDVGILPMARGEGLPYMVLEWLEGETLDAALVRERSQGAPLRTLEEVVRLLDPVAEALALAHKKGIVHRDVKPANVFVLSSHAAEKSAVKLLDFGIAKVVQDAQKMGFAKTAGHITSFTPLYGAPEQFNRSYGATSPATDVFALALVAAELASAKEPMAGDSLVQLAYASADINNRPTPRALGVATSDEVEAVFLKAVAVRPEDRYQTAGEFWSALRMALNGEPMKLSQSERSLRAAPLPIAPTVVDTSGASAAGSTFNPAHVRTGSPPPPSKTPLIVGGIVVAILAVGGVVVALKGKGADAGGGTSTASASPSAVPSVASASASPSTSAVADHGKDCPKGMLYIPGGEYFMGSDEKDSLDFERPPHKVKLMPYCLDEFEVTVGEYKACSDKGQCLRAGKENAWPGIKPAQKKIYDPLCNANDPTGKANHPINCVDYAQAVVFCKERRDGGRLPTEAEWEFAARGSDGRIYPWGDDPPGPQLLNACGKECVDWQKAHPDPDVPLGASMYDADDGFPNTAPVGSFPKGKSRSGAQDVVGNVWEWVADWYSEYDKKSSSAVGIDPKGPESGSDRVIRGGGWNGTVASWVRPSFRFHATPASRSYGFGFRCARTVSPTP